MTVWLPIWLEIRIDRDVRRVGDASIYACIAIVQGGFLGSGSNALLSGTESAERIFEDDSRYVAFAFTFRLDAILAGRTLFAALDSSLATCCPQISNPGTTIVAPLMTY